MEKPETGSRLTALSTACGSGQNRKLTKKEKENNNRLAKGPNVQNITTV